MWLNHCHPTGRDRVFTDNKTGYGLTNRIRKKIESHSMLKSLVVNYRVQNIIWWLYLTIAHKVSRVWGPGTIC